MVQEDTIAGIASGMGGGIGIIRVSGADALRIAGRVFRTKRYLEGGKNADPDGVKKWPDDFFMTKKTHTAHYGFIVDPESSMGEASDNQSYHRQAMDDISGNVAINEQSMDDVSDAAGREEVIDEVIVLLMKSPNSYTKEDVVEIDSHGGPYILQKILRILTRQGARLADPGEFTKRAFLNGRIDLSQAEAVMKMISSQNDFSLRSALDQLEGSVSGYIEDIRKEILHHMSYIEAALDDPEHISLDGFSDQLQEDISADVKRLEELLLHFEDGRLRSEGINTVIVGKPNAGKSSLMNLLLDEDRAIVTEIAGTTRDVLQEKVVLGNIILNLVDTAGIHDSEDRIENIGVDKAKEYLADADFILYLIDASMPLEEADFQIMELLQDKRGVVLFNKTDLNVVLQERDINSRLNWDILFFSNETKTGLDELKGYITDSFLKGEISYNDQVYLTSVRHRDAVESAVGSLKNVLGAIEDQMPEDFYTIDLMDAYQKLGLINGETASQDLVDMIFSEFCMGK